MRSAAVTPTRNRLPRRAEAHSGGERRGQVPRQRRLAPEARRAPQRTVDMRMRTALRRTRPDVSIKPDWVPYALH